MTGDAVRDAVALALAKAQAIARNRPGAVVIGSDTIVFDDARSYGKPTSAEEAREMLTALAGREHRVVTAVAVLSGTNVATATSISRVELTALDATVIDAYVASGRPLDKAGAYAVQDEDVPTVALLEGCYCGVMGLPLWALRGLLVAEGVTCRAPSAAFERCAECPERR